MATRLLATATVSRVESGPALESSSHCVSGPWLLRLLTARGPAADGGRAAGRADEASDRDRAEQHVTCTFPGSTPERVREFEFGSVWPVFGSSEAQRI